MRQNVNGGKGFGQTHELLGNFKKLFSCNCPTESTDTPDRKQKFSKTSVHPCNFPAPHAPQAFRANGMLCASVHCRATLPDAPGKKAEKGVIPMLATSSDHLLHHLSTPSFKSGESGFFAGGEAAQKKGARMSISCPCRGGGPVFPTFTTSHAPAGILPNFPGMSHSATVRNGSQRPSPPHREPSNASQAVTLGNLGTQLQTGDRAVSEKLIGMYRKRQLWSPNIHNFKFKGGCSCHGKNRKTNI